MRNSIGTLFLIPLTLFCWLRAYYVYKEANFSLFVTENEKPSQISFLTSADPVLQKVDNNTLGDSTDNIFYFMQITDLHISKFQKTGGTSHFLHFLATVLPVISSPAFVLVTGDLTDAKDENLITSQQFIDEWVTYHTALQESGVLHRPGFWHDLRGNHDCFNVGSWESEQNLYKKFGVGKQRGFDFTFEKNFGRYRFVGIDACPKAGIARPFNFFGYYETEDMNRLAETLSNASLSSNHTFLVSETFDDISKHISVYMCGHLHKLAWGLGDQLQTYQPTHFIELELADMKVNAIYRILAIDHDLVSFTDVALPLHEIPLKVPPSPAPGFSVLPEKLAFPPVILVTNPKDSRYLMKYHEPVHIIKESTHIRLLVWSDHDIKEIEIFLDGIRHHEQVSYKGNSKDNRVDHIPLWVSPWNPKQFDDGQEHYIIVKARDIIGQEGESKVIFRVDGERSDMRGGISEFLIGLDWALVGDMIPSAAEEGNDGIGIFWLFGIQLDSNSQWLPIFDTWRYALEDQLFLSVGIVIIWFMIITGERKWKRRYPILILGFALWLWRGSSLINLAKQYGNLAIWTNLQTLWWAFWGWYGFLRGT
ncbi:1705_t:CDS:2 [Funneliformis geosporum]|uniref:11237_t:CDS:1 n=1 Tax=Funneliformis geosporum TaxID=1117311 RepID=A0A9W4WQK4_9GLOM|nr:11237_t:CDS:2 [Funneliformis geosporum]CAI2168334.1 1705_t:CDS:2 [Funneliformis geosporum]